MVTTSLLDGERPRSLSAPRPVESNTLPATTRTRTLSQTRIFSQRIVKDRRDCLVWLLPVVAHERAQTGGGDEFYERARINYSADGEKCSRVRAPADRGREKKGRGISRLVSGTFLTCAASAARAVCGLTPRGTQNSCRNTQLTLAN